MKRLFDLVIASAVVVATLPLLAAMAIWIKLDSPGPVFYRGRRAGIGGKPFAMLKFRSMVTDADRIGGATTSGDDPRVTRSGRFVRKYKLDELSQLINVLQGEMSLVGPRPEVVDKVERYSAEERRVLTVRPGITDWASLWNADEGGVLAGCADPDAAYEQVIRPWKIALQLAYVSRPSLWTDARILAFTAVKLLARRWVPIELRGYPSFAQLRAEVEQLIEQQPAAVAA